VNHSSTDEAIRLDHVSFQYSDHDGLALDDVSLTIARGEMVVIMGATGAGKSTLAKCLNRTVPAFHTGALTGAISILGRPLRDEGVADLAGVVGLVSQDFEAQLFATNVVQEVVFGMEQLGVAPDEMKRRVPRALAAVGLRGFEHRDPATLSGGEKQRLAIAATLALQPSILVFDEPTTDLDPVGKLEIFQVLAAMRRDGYTLVVIEHEAAAAEAADRLIVMSQGRIIADDAPQHVFAQVDFLREHGVRAPDLSRLAARLRLHPVPGSLDEAEEAVRRLETGDWRLEGSEQSPSLPSSLQPLASSLDAAPLIQAEHLQFQYEDGGAALDGVSLTIRAGEFLAVIGQNGSGKTTLAKHLNGLLRPSAGHVWLRGTDISSLPINHVAADVGYVFQNPDHQIFAATVYDEVAFGPRNFALSAAEVTERVRAALDAVGIVGLDRDDPFLWSKGHRQRLAVASRLALRPRLLILDEPTTGLDYAEQRRMMDLLARLHVQGLTILMITHSPWVVAEYAQRGVLMSNGHVLFDGPLRALLAEEALLEQAHFRAPDVTRLGRRFGFTPLSVEEFAQSVHLHESPASSPQPRSS
jgi:energy-coupling factor transport system ATP-binding protein